MSDVPRNANGWPTIEPNHMTVDQLITEALKWRNSASSAPDSVGESEWKTYSQELIERGFSTRVEIQERILPHEVPRRSEPRWGSQLKKYSINVINKQIVPIMPSDTIYVEGRK